MRLAFLSLLLFTAACEAPLAIRHEVTQTPGADLAAPATRLDGIAGSQTYRSEVLGRVVLILRRPRRPPPMIL